MAAIFNLSILDSDTLLSSLRFTQKHSHSTLTLTQTNSIWLTWRWQPSRVLPSWIQRICTKKLDSFILTQLDDGSHLEFYHLEFGHLVFCHLNIFFQTDSHLPRLVPTIFTKYFTHSFWLNLMMAAILTSTMLDSDTAILDSETLLSSLRLTQNTLTPLWLWLKLIQSDSNSFILTYLDDGSHLECCHLEFGHLVFCHLNIFFQTDSHLPRLVTTICTKKHHSFILTQLDDGSHLEFCHLEFGYLGFSHLSIFFQTDSHLPRLVPTICTKNLHSFNLTQLHDSSHLEFCHLEFGHLVFCHLNIFFQTDSHLPRLVPTIFTKYFTHSFWLNLMMAAILNSVILDSDTLLSSLRFTQKHSHSTLTLTQTNSIWLKLIQSHLTWRWQESWILPSWIWPCCILPS